MVFYAVLDSTGSPLVVNNKKVLAFFKTKSEAVNYQSGLSAAKSEGTKIKCYRISQTLVV